MTGDSNELNKLYDSYVGLAKDLLAEGRLTDAKAALRNAMAVQVKLTDRTYGEERARNWSKARALKKMIDDIDIKLGDAFREEDSADRRTPAARLDELCGMEEIKVGMRRIFSTALCRERKRAGLPTPRQSYHMIFSGEPGTGKSTVARIVAEELHSLGVLSRGHLVEADRSSLVAGYVGQTAVKTAEKINEARGGVLLVCQVSELGAPRCTGRDFGVEALDVILRAIDGEDDLVVIFEDYDECLTEFLKFHPEVALKFGRTVHFDGFSSDELIEIFASMCKRSQFVLTEDAGNAVADLIRKICENRGKHFGNVRVVRGIFEKTIQNQIMRISDDVDGLSKEKLATIEPEDIPSFRQCAD